MHWLVRFILVATTLSACKRDSEAMLSKPHQAKEDSITDSVIRAPAPPPKNKKKKPQITFQGKGGEIQVEIEVVHTPPKIQRGLMHRRHMAPDRGMLFIFSTERLRSFWMKNTLIPLDMFFVKSDMTIAGIVRDTVPLSLESRSIDTETQFVIEMNGGWAADNGVQVGSKVQFSHLPEAMQPPL